MLRKFSDYSKIITYYLKVFLTRTHKKVHNLVKIHNPQGIFLLLEKLFSNIKTQCFLLANAIS